MKKFFIPGINGLGNTKGVEKNKKFLEDFNFKEINLDLENIKVQLNQIYLSAKNFVHEKFFVLGGDHSISFPIMKAFFETYGSKSKLLIFDAHFDLMEPMPEPSHEEWLRGIIELGFDEKNILIVGIRKESKNIDVQEINYAKEKQIKIIYPPDFKNKKEEILNFVSSGKVYASFDIDVFDSLMVGSTGYPESKGLGEEVFDLLEEIKKFFFGFDLVEINLEKGTEEEKKNTFKVGRKVLKTVLSE